jgi:hypothetical protein
MAAQLDGVAPPGWERSIKKMKKHSDIANPFALAWWMKKRGAHPSRRDETEAAVDPVFEAALAEAQALAAAGRIPDVFYAAARGETTACSLLLHASGKLHVEQRR